MSKKTFLEKFQITPPVFEWDEFKTDQERIKALTKRFEGLSISESFAQMYGYHCTNSESSIASSDYKAVKAGEVIHLKIKDVTKKGVIFEQDNYKENIICNNNLYQYERFREFIPKNPLMFKVLSKNHNQIVVDMFAAYFDDFINDKSNFSQQYNVELPKPISVRNLKLTRGGYMGNVRINKLSDILGYDMCVEAFIPGSQIVLNIESDFEKWEGKDVTAFVTNVFTKTNSKNKILICSRKEYWKFLGNVTLINMFKHYCEDNKTWKDTQDNVFNGVITGICNTNNKCGVFVEIPSLLVTGMVQCDKSELTKYLKGSPVDVKIVGFNELKKYNSEVGQMQHVEPYEIDEKTKQLKSCNLKVVLNFA